LFNSTKNYHHLLIVSPGDTSRLPDVSFTITSGNDLVWNGQTFKLSAGSTYMPGVFGNNSVDTYVDGEDVPGHFGTTSSYVVFYSLYYCAATDKVIVQAGQGNNEYWESF
jgi:hypothetical protein